VACRQPFRRRRARRHEGGADAFELVRAFEYAARTWGWTAAYINEHETDERLLAYLDAAEERDEAEFRNRIEAVRLGTIFAHDAKSYGSWSRRARRAEPAVSARSLEAAVMGLAATHPEYVVIGP
jgi:hypothetical protein